MPIKRFWFYSKCVDRIAAEEGLKMIELFAAAQSGELYEKVTQRLQDTLGEIYVAAPPDVTSLEVTDENGLDPNFEKDKFHAFRARIAAAGR